MNAEWNTVLAERPPLSTPGSLTMTTEAGLRGTAISGRTALVGGFMKGVEAAHERFGKLPSPGSSCAHCAAYSSTSTTITIAATRKKIFHALYG
jgi:hypothetical protein